MKEIQIAGEVVCPGNNMVLLRTVQGVIKLPEALLSLSGKTINVGVVNADSGKVVLAISGVLNFFTRNGVVMIRLRQSKEVNVELSMILTEFVGQIIGIGITVEEPA